MVCYSGSLNIEKKKKKKKKSPRPCLGVLFIQYCWTEISLRTWMSLSCSKKSEMEKLY